MILCTYSAYPSVLSKTLFFIGLFAGVGIGTGGIKPNVVVLGAEQFDTRDPDQAVQQVRFFNYFYWSINIGLIILLFNIKYCRWINCNWIFFLFSNSWSTSNNIKK